MSVVARRTLDNGWSFDTSSVVEYFSASAIEQALDLIRRWISVFPKGTTWVGKEYNVPSLFIRLDCIVDTQGALRVFEIEERPAGIGATMRLNPFFAERFAQVQRQWPSFKWVRVAERNTDDADWLGEGMTLEQALHHDGLLLVRSRPETVEYHPLEDRSVSTIRHEGDKRYGVELGLWSIVRWQSDPQEESGGYVVPAVKSPCVLKPVQGTRCRNVKAYLNGSIDMVRVDGVGKVPHLGGVRLIKVANDTLGIDSIERHVRASGEMFSQPFVMPMRLSHQSEKNAIYRFYFGFSPQKNAYVPLGGVWAASRSLLVHGTDDTVFGPLMF